MTSPLHFIHPVTTGQPTYVGDTAFVPLLGEQHVTCDLAYTLLDQALRTSNTEVTEVNARGAVSRIRVSHHGSEFLLILDGEQVVGAKQDRIFNASFVVAPGSDVELPVSCVERGRWSTRSPWETSSFDSSETTFVGSARGKKLRRVAHSAIRRHGYDADQQSVWSDVDRYLTTTHTRSRTFSFNDGYRTSMDAVREQVERLQPQPGQVGLAVVREAKLVQLDVFAAASLYRDVWRKLVNGALAEVNLTGKRNQDAQNVVARVARVWSTARLFEQNAPGCGKTLHGVADSVAFGALEHEDKLLHVVASEA